MRSIKKILFCSSLLLLSLYLTSCTKEPPQKISEPAAQESIASPPQTVGLPVQYQTPSYLVDKKAGEDLSIAEEGKLKVGARITSTRGPQPLWDIIKRLAALKGMNVSWSSDVDRNVLVDVDINANDGFYESLDNMLRQVDYFHEMKDNTIVIKYKETRQFQIAMPFTKQSYTANTGGNVLGNSETSSNIEGTIAIKSDNNEFDIWENIKLNIESIMDIWSYRREANMVQQGTTTAGGGEEAARSYKAGAEGAVVSTTSADSAVTDEKKSAGSQSQVGGQGYYIIDKPVGLITVTAPRPILEKIDAYITTLKKSLYQQISIEAKIIEVQLRDASSIGINWSSVLQNFALSGLVEFGTGGALGQVYPFIYSNDEVQGPVTFTDEARSAYFKTNNPGQFVSKISMAAASFDVFLNALNEEGDTKILSNPKISVMNGQPSLITVGRNVTYIDKIDSKIDSETGIVTFTVDTERILSGVGMALTATILGNDEVIMNLVPITAELQEPIEYRDVGNLGATVGLPVINVREMSTTVKVKDGEMLVIGGLITDQKQSTGEFAPILGDIPFVKYLFGYEEKEHLKRELIILLRPRII
ncbi:MAG: hypothetical protein VR65_02350 [Desulfobulbaceae bacterium BRH_c16a]|nr:MAG: hypothetical protein VR65_02350 [Desulfobulbaceae bacterium BRH_c16a]